MPLRDVFTALSTNLIDPFEFWIWLKEAFGVSFLKSVLESEYGIIDEETNGLKTW